MLFSLPSQIWHWLNDRMSFRLNKGAFKGMALRNVDPDIANLFTHRICVAFHIHVTGMYTVILDHPLTLLGDYLVSRFCENLICRCEIISS